jgi:hypothetical protein
MQPSNLGRSIIKSIDILYYILLGISKGFNSLYY